MTEQVKCPTEAYERKYRAPDKAVGQLKDICDKFNSMMEYAAYSGPHPKAYYIYDRARLVIKTIYIHGFSELDACPPDQIDWYMEQAASEFGVTLTPL